MSKNFLPTFKIFRLKIVLRCFYFIRSKYRSEVCVGLPIFGVYQTNCNHRSYDKKRNIFVSNSTNENYEYFHYLKFDLNLSNAQNTFMYIDIAIKSSIFCQKKVNCQQVNSRFLEISIFLNQYSREKRILKAI